MDNRKMMLPEGWYPHSYKTAESMIKQWDSSSAPVPDSCIGGIGPHAGWFYSGKLSWNVVQSIPSDTELIIIAGGHLSATQEHRLLNYKYFETPFGLLKIDSEAKDELCDEFIDDFEPDNTVEIYLPFIKYLFPDISILPVRLSPSKEASDWAMACAAYCKMNKKRTFFLGSTDLSHYGSRFRYTDFGTGVKAKDKIYSIDHSFLSHLNTMNMDLALEDIASYHCACSGGAAIGAASFSQELGKKKGLILNHYYSFNVTEDNEDFVGYGAVLYS